MIPFTRKQIQPKNSKQAKNDLGKWINKQAEKSQRSACLNNTKFVSKTFNQMRNGGASDREEQDRRRLLFKINSKCQ